MSQLTIDRAILEVLLEYAASAACLVGHIKDGTVPRLLAENIDKIGLKLGELLGNPHLIEENARRRTEAANARRRAEDAAPAGALMERVPDLDRALLVDRRLLEGFLEVFLEHAAPAAARLVGRIEDGTASGLDLDLLAKKIDQNAHVLCELFSNLHLIAANARRRTEDTAPAVALMERVPDAQADGT